MCQVRSTARGSKPFNRSSQGVRYPYTALPCLHLLPALSAVLAAGSPPMSALLCARVPSLLSARALAPHRAQVQHLRPRLAPQQRAGACSACVWVEMLLGLPWVSGSPSQAGRPLAAFGSNSNCSRLSDSEPPLRRRPPATSMQGEHRREKPRWRGAARAHGAKPLPPWRCPCRRPPQHGRRLLVCSTAGSDADDRAEER